MITAPHGLTITLVTGISVPDPDLGPGAMPIYEGLTPETGLVDGTYTALLSTDRRSEPLEVLITISDGRLTAPPALNVRIADLSPQLAATQQ